jgi:hypothetical protein
MSAVEEKYRLGDVDFSHIRNRNEGRVVKELGNLLRQKNNALLSEKDVQDIYALALNALPPRYAQRGTIVLKDPVRREEIVEALEEAYSFVMERPKP